MGKTISCFEYQDAESQPESAEHIYQNDDFANDLCQVKSSKSVKILD